jgi:hypothetical protein
VSRFVETSSYKWSEDKYKTPLKGEICIIEIPQGSTDYNLPEIYRELNQTIYLIKYGDGTNFLVNLPWVEDIGTIFTSKTFVLDCNIDNS